MKASAGGHSDVVHLLISAGARLDEEDNVGRVCCIIYNSIRLVIGEQL